MTLDEAITLLKFNNKHIADLKNDDLQQITEWLEDYKHIKQWKSDIMDSFCKYDVSSFEELVTNARNKAIDDFAKWLENKKYLMKEIQDHDFCYTHYDELKANCVITEYFAEQLKGEVASKWQFIL